MAENNIYRDKGLIVSKERYIHRDIEKTVIDSLLDEDNFGSQSVVGMQRIGKSSLAYNCLREISEQLFSEKRTIVIDITMSKFEDSETFFTTIMKKTHMFLKKHAVEDGVLNDLYDMVLTDGIRSNGGEELLEYYNWLISQLEYKVVCIVDEFDKSKELFEAYPEGFQVLRDMTYQPDNRIAFLFLSRRMVEELEKFAGYDVSNFANVLTTHFLSVYSDDELATYFDKLRETGVTVTKEVEEDYLRYTGGYPYWMDILSSFYLDDSSSSVKTVYEEHELEFFKLFDGLMDLLKDQDLLNALYQIVLGPMGEDATRDKILALCNYGIVKEKENGEYLAVSPLFREYMIMKERTIDFYPLWNRAEKLLRKTICVCLGKVYGENWASKVYSKYTTSEFEQPRRGNKPVASLFREAQNLIERMKRNHSMFDIGEDEYNFVYGGTTSLLAEVIIQEYDRCFKDVFLMPLEDFRNTIFSIISVRNPYDHNNDQLIRASSKQEGASKIKQIVELMNKYFGD